MYIKLSNVIVLLCLKCVFPGPPEGPVQTVETTSSLIEIKWNPPQDDSGSAVTNYIIERQADGPASVDKTQGCLS